MARRVPTTAVYGERHGTLHLAKALGRPPELEDHQITWSMYFSDPDGNPFEITSYDHAALEPTLRREGR